MLAYVVAYRSSVHACPIRLGGAWAHVMRTVTKAKARGCRRSTVDRTEGLPCELGWKERPREALTGVNRTGTKYNRASTITVVSTVLTPYITVQYEVPRARTVTATALSYAWPLGASTYCTLAELSQFRSVQFSSVQSPSLRMICLSQPPSLPGLRPLWPPTAHM